MLKKGLIAVACCCALFGAEPPLVSISPVSVKDLLKGKDKSGIVVGGGVGLPSFNTQYLSGERFTYTTSYGYHLMVGYQDFARMLTPFTPNLFGARASLEFSDTYHITSEGLIDSKSILLNYDMLFDPFARRNFNNIGFILGLNTGVTRISGYQGFSFSMGVKAGISLVFDTDSRLDITYRVASTGPLKGNELHFYSPYTINVTYTYRFTLPQDPPRIDNSDIFDNTKLLIKAQPQQ